MVWNPEIEFFVFPDIFPFHPYPVVFCFGFLKHPKRVSQNIRSCSWVLRRYPGYVTVRDNWQRLWMRFSLRRWGSGLGETLGFHRFRSPGIQVADFSPSPEATKFGRFPEIWPKNFLKGPASSCFFWVFSQEGLCFLDRHLLFWGDSRDSCPFLRAHVSFLLGDYRKKRDLDSYNFNDFLTIFSCDVFGMMCILFLDHRIIHLAGNR